jgi:hypothetical protein
MKNTIAEVYKEKRLIEKKIYNMIRQFEDKHQLIITTIDFGHDDKEKAEQGEYDRITLVTEFINDPKKIKI